MNKSVMTVAASYIIWGLLPIFWKLLSQVDPIYTLCSRIIWSMVMGGIAVILTGKQKQVVEALKNKAAFGRLLVSGLLVSVNWGMYIWCVMKGRVLDSSLAYYINPIIAVVVGYLMFNEKLSRLQWFSVLLATVGVALPAFREGQVPIMAILIATSFAIYSALKKKLDLPGDITTFVETLFVAPVATAVIVFMELNGSGAISNGVLTGWSQLLLPAAGLVTYLPLVMFSQGIRKTPMSLSGILMYVNPTIQFILGILLFKEELSATSIVTFCFVWAALIIFVSNSRISSKRSSELEIGGA